MKQCGKLVTMGHGDHAKCGEDYWGKFFQCAQCQLIDLLIKKQEPGKHPGMCPFKIEEVDHGVCMVTGTNKDVSECLAQAAHTDANSSPTTPNSPTPGQEDFRTLQGLAKGMSLSLHWSLDIFKKQEAMEDRLTSMERRLDELQSHHYEMMVMLRTIIDALAEDQDPDEMPATYMDGSPVR